LNGASRAENSPRTPGESGSLDVRIREPNDEGAATAWRLGGSETARNAGRKFHFFIKH